MESQSRLALADRLINRAQNLEDASRVRLIQSVLTNFCGLTDDQLSAFVLSSDQLGTAHMEDVMRYATAEASIALSFNGGSKVGVFAEDPEVAKRSVSAMKEAIKAEVLYPADSQDMGMFIDSLTPMDVPFLISEIVGTTHPLWRRIRNAYIPGMVDVVTVQYDDVGNLVSAENKTGELFDGNDDAVDVVEKLMGN
ncbi:MAG TPA: hypothetical protein VG965_05315 [Patescibacteria group bacterium]|nr:hypothetical protein [Patescibacteria group bacterium]